MSWMLRTEGLAKAFTLHLQAGLRIPVLDGVDFEVASGECVVLHGPSGVGKSTLMRCLYGNYGAGAGRILVQHRGEAVDLAAAEPRIVRAVRCETIGHVSQFLRVIPRVPAIDVVAEPLRARGVAPEEARARAAATMLRLNLPTRLHALPPATFSGGEQQRVNLARGFVAPWPVMLLDEPTASLDATNRDAVVALIEEAQAAGTAVVGIFHDADLRRRVGSRQFDVASGATAGAGAKPVA
jgi:alpha-D-ribose 1-methylphosphonate 5-triphosphate synthase subunit PhnL